MCFGQQVQDFYVQLYKCDYQCECVELFYVFWCVLCGVVFDYVEVQYQVQCCQVYYQQVEVDVYGVGFVDEGDLDVGEGVQVDIYQVKQYDVVGGCYYVYVEFVGDFDYFGVVEQQYCCQYVYGEYDCLQYDVWELQFYEGGDVVECEVFGNCVEWCGDVGLVWCEV